MRPYITVSTAACHPMFGLCQSQFGQDHKCRGFGPASLRNFSLSHGAVVRRKHVWKFAVVSRSELLKHPFTMPRTFVFPDTACIGTLTAANTTHHSNANRKNSESSSLLPWRVFFSVSGILYQTWVFTQTAAHVQKPGENADCSGDKRTIKLFSQQKSQRDNSANRQQ